MSNNNNSRIEESSSSRRRPSALPTLIEEDNSANSQASMKQRILLIQNNQTLTPKEKAEGMQNLMMQKWNASQEQASSSKQDGCHGTQCCPMEVEQNNLDASKVTTFNDEANRILGCEHYKRGVKLLSNCCGKWYTCRFCHDEVEDHVFDRYGTLKVSCMECHTIQDLSTNCVNSSCKARFAKYYCETCRFYDNEEEKDIYHCDKCKICRIGKGLGIDYFHCDKCNACMSTTLTQHKCVERSLESNCPICSVYMFTSTTPVMFLPCGHCMHVSCYEEYTLTNYICPLCSKSLGDMQMYFKRIDEVMALERMPDEFKRHRSQVFCSDCERKSTTRYHFIYHKCQFPDCGSYNTKVIRQFELAAGQPEEVLDLSTPGAPSLHQHAMVEYD